MEGQTQNKMVIRKRIPKPQFSILQFVLLLFPLFFRSFIFVPFFTIWLWLSGTDRAGTRVHIQRNKVYNNWKMLEMQVRLKDSIRGNMLWVTPLLEMLLSFSEPIRHLSKFEQSLIVGEKVLNEIRLLSANFAYKFKM